MDFDSYETLPTNNIATHMTAGAVAGIMEHCVMYPLDSVKTRMQNLSPSPNAVYRGVGEALVKMVKQEGILRPVRGMSAVVVGAGPAHALYFSCYEHLKEKFTQKNSKNNHLAYGAAGCVATLLHDGVMNPAEVVKQRLQMYNSPYKSCMDCVAKVYRVEGLQAFYRSYTTQLTMNIPFQSIHFMMYEFVTSLTNADRSYNPSAHMLSGAVAGAVAAAVTTPLDVCKTLLNTQPHTAQGSGLFSAIRTVYKLGGLSGYFKGLQARVLYQMPSTAICWSIYEFFKFVLIAPTTDISSDHVVVSSLPLRIIVPQASLAAESPVEISMEGKTRLERSSGSDWESWSPSAPIKGRELPSVSGAGLYGALSLNTVHNADSNLQKGSTLLDISRS